MITRQGQSRSRQFWTSRGVALVAIVMLHAGMLILALLQRARAVEEAPPQRISVALLASPREEPVARVALTAPLEAPPLPSVVMPEFEVEREFEQEERPAAAITVVAEAAPPRSSTVGDLQAPLMVSQVDYLRMPSPRYPPLARRARHEGLVELRVLIDMDGHAREIWIHRSSGYPDLDKAAQESVYAALFRPYSVNGAARSVVVIVPIEFSLKRATNG
jgi:protein TonB